MLRRAITRISTFYQFSSRKIIEPQPFTIEKVDDFHLISSDTYEFVTSKLPEKHLIYRHETQTPAAVLKKPGFHIFPKQIPELNRRQKFQALSKKLQTNYENAFKNCQNPKQIFHLNRKIKTQIKNKLDMVGVVQDKYKHYMKFTPFGDILSHKTKQQYLKKGVNVKLLGFTIYPKGEVWMPTNEKYLQDFVDVLKILEGNVQIRDILDIGCGSGVLSFLCSKSFKKAKIAALDINQAAVDTCNVTAAQNKLLNIHALQFDISKANQFKQKIKQQKISDSYDLIVINPPWLHAKKLPGESQLEGGVYDQKGMFLRNSLKLASTHLRNKQSKILMIYSDLNKILGLQNVSVEELCKQYNLIIKTIKERPLSYNIEKPSPLTQFKQQAKILLYQLGKA